MRNGFTLLEVIFTISIMSFVLMISSSEILRIYDTVENRNEYTKTVNELDMAAVFLENYLENSIKESVVSCGIDSYNECEKLGSDNPKTSMLLWIGSDENGKNGSIQNGYYLPFWSGVVDIENSNYDYIVDSLADFEREKIALQDTCESGVHPAIYFSDSSVDSCDDFYQNGGKQMHEVDLSGKKLFFKNKTPLKLSDRYFLSNSAYAVSLESNILYFYHDFHPWRGQKILDGRKSVIATNISSFGFASDNGVIRLNICSTAISGSQQICIERAIF